MSPTHKPIPSRTQLAETRYMSPQTSQTSAAITYTVARKAAESGAEEERRPSRRRRSRILMSGDSVRRIGTVGCAHARRSHRTANRPQQPNMRLSSYAGLSRAVAVAEDGEAWAKPQARWRSRAAERWRKGSRQREEGCPSSSPLADHVDTALTGRP